MAIRLNNSAEGSTNGTAIASGSNTGGGSGDVFAASKTSTATLQFSSTQKAHGSLAYFFSFTTASESAYLQWQPAGETAASYGLRGYIWIAANPAANDQFIAGLRNTAPANVLSIAVSTAGKFRILDASGSTIYTSTTAIAASTWTRFELVATRGTTTANGFVKFKFFTGDSTSAIDTEFTSSSVNLGILDLAAVRFGRTTGLASTWSFYLDDLALQTNSTTYIGEYGANTPPVVSVGSDIILAYTGAAQTVGLTSSATDDGSVAGYSWANTLVRSSQTTTTITPATPLVANTNVTVTQPGRYDFTVTVTDNLGAPSTAVQSVYVTTPTPKPSGLVANPGAWTNQGGAASLNAALADASDTTFNRSPGAPVSEATVQHYLDPMPVMAGIDFVVRSKLSAAGTGVPKVRLYEDGLVMRKEWTATVPSTSAGNQTLSLTALEAAALATPAAWLNCTLELGWA